MKKIIKNKKGFTLIELLAVIVVLAIIMVIATQQVNKTISKSRANSFLESAQMAFKTAKLLIADNNLSTDSLRDEMSYNTDQYQIYVYYMNASSHNYVDSSSNARSDGVIVLKADGNGKFKDVDLSTINENNYYKDDTGNKICVKINSDGQSESITDGDNVCASINP